MAQALRHKFTVEQYERMGEAGILTQDDRVELVAGEIAHKPVIGPRHAASVRKCTTTFVRRCGDDVIVSPPEPGATPGRRSQSPSPDSREIR